MALRFSCPSCGAEITVQYLSKGESAKCFSCGSVVVVPSDALEGQFKKPVTSPPKASEDGSSATEVIGEGIGGWLILPAIGFVLGPLGGIAMLFISLQLYSDVAAAGYGGLYAFEIFVQAGLLAFVIYAATRFFGKKRNAPSTIIALVIVSVVSSGLLLVIELSAGAEVFAVETGKQLAKQVVGAAIWIPYFSVSKRVKATFIK